MQIYLTADFFFEPDLTFWICLQPHIKVGVQADLDVFMQGLGKSSNFQYTLWRRDADTTGLVPVPFASDADLHLKLIGAAAGFDLRSNLRTKAVQLDAGGWSAFEDANRDEDETENRTGNDSSQFAIGPGPFSPVYNSTLQTTWSQIKQQAQTDPTIDPIGHMCQMLTAAFWGGTRRRLPTAANAGNTAAISIMALQEIVPTTTPFSGTITNLHSLAGLMFKVGSRGDAASLKAVTDLQLDIDTGDGSGPKPVLKFSDVAWAKPTVTAFFSSLSDMLPATRESSLWNADLGKRAYVSDGATRFSPQKMGGQLWFRRKQDDDSTANHPPSSALRSIEVRFSGDTAPATTQMKLLLYDSFDVVILPYGNSRPGPTGRLLQLRPRIDEKETFYSEVKGQLAGDPNWFTGANKPHFFDHDGNEKTFTYVGNYALPWGLDPLTILFYGPAMDPSDALMLFPRPGSLPLALKGDNPRIDPFGLRYEAILPTGTGNFTFDTLVNAQPGQADGDLIVAATFAGQSNFDLAQSISNIEGNLEVQYPAPLDPADQDSINAADEYLHDLLNYNCANVLAKYPGAIDVVHLNPKTELFPAFSVMPGDQTTEAKDHYSAYFHFRYSDPVLPDAAAGAAPFFSDLYGRLGGTVALSFNIEHTYGTIIPLRSNGDVTSYVNFAPVLPNELTLTGDAAKKASDGDQYFCSITLDTSQAIDQISLVFRPAWLSPEWAADKDLGSFSVAAWRSIAELAFADKILITGKFLRFNFRTALKDTTDDVLAQGFEAVPEFDNWQADITAIVRPAVAAWLASGRMGAPSFAPIPVNVASGTRIGPTCTVVEFDLTLSRKAAILPPAPGSLHFVRPSATFSTGPQGQAMDPVAAADVLETYIHWTGRLTSRKAPIAPLLSAGDKQFAADLRNFLGATEKESGAWIPPRGLVNPTAQVIPSVCPAAFRPLARHPLLGDGTYQTVANYLWALDIVLRGAVQESATMQAADWKTYFASLQARAGDLTALVEKMMSLVAPVPNTAAAELDREVSACASNLGSQKTPEYAAFRQWLQGEIWAAPAIFGDSKAFLYTRLKGTGADGLTPQEFARMNFTKLPKLGGSGSADDPNVIDADRSLVWESLRDLRDFPGFGFAETLDILHYRDNFGIKEFSLSSLQGLVEMLRAPNAGAAEPVPISLVNGDLHLPIGAVAPGDAAVVQLPSREPVTAPVHHFTGQIKECEQNNGLETAAVGALQRDPLLSGSVQALAQSADPTSPIACLIAKPATPINRDSLFLDQYILSTIFSIRGDEESTIEWNQAFVNDRFHLHLDEPAQQALASKEKVDDFIANLTQTLSPDILPSLHDSVLHTQSGTDILQFFIGALEPSPPPGDVSQITALPYLEIAPVGVGADLRFLNADGTTIKEFEGYLFKTGVASAGCGVKPIGSSLILLINMQASAWKSSWVSIQQTRNLLSGADQVHFANSFATVAPLTGPPDGAQPIVTKNVSPQDGVIGNDTLLPAAVELPRQRYSAADLVNRLLFSPGPDSGAGPRPRYLDSVVTGNQWRGFDLSITFRARQMVTNWTVYVDEEGNVQTDKQLAPHSSLGHAVFISKATTPEDFDAPHDWMDPDIDDYFVDFHWSSGSNLPFFSISGVPIKIGP